MRGYGTRQDYFSTSPFLGLASPPFWTRVLLWGAAAVFAAVFAFRHFAQIELVPFLGLSLSGLGRGFVWQLLTYPFVHTGVFALLFNLLVFWLFGSEVEAALGSRRFLRLITAGVLASAAAFTAVSLFRPQPLLFGADAVVFSLLAAYSLLFPKREITLLLLLIFPVRMKAGWLALLIAGVTVLVSLGDVGPQGLFALAAGPVAWLMLRGLPRYGRAERKQLSGWLVRVVRIPRRKPGTNADAREQISRQEIDRILDKISAHGFQSLTAEEKKTLDRGRDLFRQEN